MAQTKRGTEHSRARLLKALEETKEFNARLQTRVKQQAYEISRLRQLLAAAGIKQ